MNYEVLMKIGFKVMPVRTGVFDAVVRGFNPARTRFLCRSRVFREFITMNSDIYFIAHGWYNILYIYRA